MPPSKNPRKKNASSFKKGADPRRCTKGVPKGTPSYDAEELAVRKIDKGMVSRYLTVNSHLTKDQLKAKLKNEQVPILEHAVISSLIRAATSGDYYVLDNIFDRMVGKVPNKIEHAKADPFEGKSIDELMQMKRELTESNIKTLRLLEQTERVKQQEREVIELTAKASGGNNNGN